MLHVHVPVHYYIPLLVQYLIYLHLSLESTTLRLSVNRSDIDLYMYSLFQYLIMVFVIIELLIIFIVDVKCHDSYLDFLMLLNEME